VTALNLLLLFAGLAAAQIPASDSRNTSIPNTDTQFRMPEYRTKAQWEKRREQLRKQILFAAGLYPLPKKPKLRSLVFGRIENSDYSVEKVAIETMPGYWLGGNLYRPLGKPGKHPGIASPHGHWLYGRLENQPLASVPARGISLARQGFVVMTYDMVGYNDTAQTPHAFGEDKVDQLWSFGPLGLQLWNSIRVLDFLETLPDVDPAQLGGTGASGGATQLMMLAAVDDRIRFSAPVNMISSIMQGGSPCENAPGLRIDANNMEIGAMMAPRPMLMIAATGDWTRNTPKVEFPAVRSIYDLYDARPALETTQFDAPHNYNQASREAVYRFFSKVVLHNPAEFKEKGIRIEKLQDMLVWQGRSLPEGSLDFDGVRRAWKEMGKAQIAAATEPALMKERLQLALASQWPGEAVTAAHDGERLFLTRTGKGDRIPAAVIGSGKPTRLVVDSNGIEAARNRPDVKKWQTAGETLLLIDAFQTGSAKAPRDRSHKFFLTFNKSDDAERVQDILTALAWMRTQSAEVRLSAADSTAAIWATFAAAVSPVPVKLDGVAASFSGSDGELVSNFFVPGIQRAGGWEAARKLIR
jgi:dienelactone hydrolase